MLYQKKPEASVSKGARGKTEAVKTDIRQFFGLIRENIHESIGVLWLGLVVMLFNYPVNLALQLSSLRQSFQQTGAVTFTKQLSEQDPSVSVFFAEKTPDFMKEAKALSRHVLDGSQTLIYFIIVAAALLCAYAMFRYLFRKTMVDYYHSQPFKRAFRFWANYLSGILIFLICLACGLFAAYLVCAAFQVSGSITMSRLVFANAGWFLLFLLCYQVFLLAILLTGSIGTAIGAAFFLFAAGPLLSQLFTALMSSYFTTFVSIDPRIEEFLLRLSPFYLAGHFLNGLNPGSGISLSREPWLLPGMAFRAALLCGVCLLLFLRRPSEAAGTAMAFAKSKRPFRLLLSVMMGLCCSLFGIGVHSFGWSLFFLLAGTVLTHAILEIVFCMDVRALFRDKLELGSCVLCAGMLLCLLHFDWIGYDSWLPARDALASVSISESYAHSLEARLAIPLAKQTYSAYDKLPGRDELVPGQMVNFYDQDPASELDLMQLTKQSDIDQIFAMAKAGLANQNTADFSVAAEEAIPVILDKADGPEADGEADDAQTIPLHVRYRMKNGRQHERIYQVPEPVFLQCMNTLFRSSDYKTALFPILQLNASDLGTFGLTYPEGSAYREAVQRAKQDFADETAYFPNNWFQSSQTRTFAFGKDKTFSAELLKALQTDLSNMQFTDYAAWYSRDVNGNATLRKPILHYLPKETLLLADAAGEAYCPITYEDIYPVFDSFTAVRAVLKAHGLL